MPKKPTTAIRGSADAVARIEKACRRAVLGKLAMRDIAAWVAKFDLSETEFRVLWLLYSADDEGRPPLDRQELDQADVAKTLAVSAAQVSAVVDRLRQAGRIATAPTPDRRRQVWCLTSGGRELLQTIISAVALSPAALRDKEAA
jgi:DNA-binding MarR family transcriptional regulator